MARVRWALVVGVAVALALTASGAAARGPAPSAGAPAPRPVSSPSSSRYGDPLDGAVSVATGFTQTCAVLDDTTVSCWGVGGQLGDGTTVPRSLAETRVLGLNAPIEIRSGGVHTCAVTSENLLLCWGYGSTGQLGNASTAPALSPVTVPLTGVAHVAPGSYHTCASRLDGTVWCWGDNSGAQMGNGAASFSPQFVPTQVAGLSDVVDVASGSLFSCARKLDQTVWCWGANFLGEPQVGSRTLHTTPVQITGVEHAVAIASASSGFSSCALIAGGTVRCWGDNSAGQLGDGTTTSRAAAVVAIGLTGVDQIAVGESTCARVGTTAWCWGPNSWGSSGDGSPYLPRFTPAPSPAFGSVMTLSAGGPTCAVRTDGTVWCAGDNRFGGVGSGNAVSLSTPSAVGTGTRTRRVAPAAT